MFATEDTRTIEFDNGETVELKEISYGEQNQINQKAVSINYVTQKPEMDMAVMQEQTLKTAIKDWSFTDAEGEKVKVNLDNIRKLKAEVASYIFNEINGSNRVDEEEKKK